MIHLYTRRVSPSRLSLSCCAVWPTVRWSLPNGDAALSHTAGPSATSGCRSPLRPQSPGKPEAGQGRSQLQSSTSPAATRSDHTRTHIDHSIGGNSEEGGSLVHRFHSVVAVGAAAQILQFVEGALEGGAVLSYQLVTGAQVVQLGGQSLEHPLG